MKKNRAIKFGTLISLISISLSASAQMAGSYEILKSDCNDFIFSQAREAVVVAQGSRFQVGILSHQTPDGSARIISGFDYQVGTKKQDCLVEACYSIFVNSYSFNKKQFVHTLLQAKTHASSPEFVKKVTFTLSENELKIENNNKVCLFKKIK